MEAGGVSGLMIVAIVTWVCMLAGAIGIACHVFRDSRRNDRRLRAAGEDSR